MVKIAPLILPRQLVTDHAIDPAHDFQHRPVAATRRPQGGCYVLHHIYYNYAHYDSSDRREFNTYLLSEYDEQLEHVLTREIPWLYQRAHWESLASDGVTLEYDSNSRVDLCCTAPDELAILTSGNRVFVVDQELRLTHEWAKAHAFNHARLTAAANFAGQLDVLPDGRWLATVCEETNEVGLQPSIVACSDEPVRFADGRPTLRYLTSLRHGQLDKYLHTPEQVELRRGTYPYLLLNGEPFNYKQRRVPTLADRANLLCRAAYVRALSNENMVVSYFDRIPRSRNALDTNACAWIIASLTGEPLARLDEQSMQGYHPFVPVGEPHEAFCCHRESGLVLVKTRDAFFHFGVGVQVGCQPLSADAKHKAFRHVRIVPMTCSGPPLFFHGAHHALVTPQPFSRPDEWPSVRQGMITGYAPALKALGKNSAFARQSDRWIGA